MKYGRFAGNNLVEVFIPPAGHAIEECFHPSLVFEEVPSDAEVGWVKDEMGNIIDPNFTPPPIVEQEESAPAAPPTPVSE